MTTILRPDVAKTINRLLMGADAPRPNGDTPAWQIEWYEQIKTSEPAMRTATLRQLVNGHEHKAAIYAQLYTADAPERDPEKLPYTDAGNAEMIATIYGERLRYDHRLGRWLIWDGQRWQADNDGHLIRLVLDAMRRRQELALKIRDVDQKKRAMSWTLGSESYSKMVSAINIAKNLDPLTDNGTGWDSNDWLLGVGNGVLDLRTGTLRNALPDDRITLNTEIDYNPDATAPRWEQFLSEIFDGDDELVGFIQRAVGYTLTGDTREQCLFLCHGGGANGKSVLLDILRTLLGDYAKNTPFSTFEMDRNNANTNDLAALSRVRLVTAAETNEAQRLNEARVKAITGGDPITARFLHKEFFEYLPSFKVWLAMNHKPRILGADDGIWRRIRLIPFNVKFKGKDADKTLPDKLNAELGGILAWAVRGALDWQNGGLREPQVVVAETVNYRHESNNVLIYLDEQTIQNPQARIVSSTLYKKYRDWCNERGDYPISIQEFGRRMSDAGYISQKISGYKRYTGIELPTKDGLFDD